MTPNREASALEAWTVVRSIAAMFLGLLLSACHPSKHALPSQAELSALKADYEASLKSAKRTIPFAIEFLRLYPEGAAYWSYYTGQAGQPTLSMEALLFGRYELTVQVPVAF